MNTVEEENNKRWFAMRVTYRRELELRDRLTALGIETFIPMHYSISVRGRQRRRVLVPVIHNLIFVYTSLSVLQDIKRTIPYFQYMTDSRSGEKIIVPEVQMRRFIAVSGTYSEQLTYIRPEEVTFRKGTRVRVTGGEFEGMEGVFLKIKGARDKRVVVSIQGVMAVALATIHPDLIEPLPDETNTELI